MIAMSGGVDSSVCGYLLREMGYKVIAISFILYDDGDFTNIQLAKQTAESLRIPHVIIDVRQEFYEEVIKPFYEQYSRGLTPNPCVICNRTIKFKRLLDEADRHDIYYISTGHYARIKGGNLFKGADYTKDQSYVLYRLSTQQLQRTILPLGELQKERVKAIAQEHRLPTSCARESQEVCFLKGKSYTEHFKHKKTGVIRHIKTGRILGHHNGIEHFTIGQRKRLGINSPIPLYVVSIEAETNTVNVGDFEDAHGSIVRVRNINWIVRKNKDFTAEVKIRYTMKPQPAIVSIIEEDGVIVKFNTPQWAPAPGQSAVFYDDEMVIGGGIIY